MGETYTLECSKVSSDFEKRDKCTTVFSSRIEQWNDQTCLISLRERPRASGGSLRAGIPVRSAAP
jgi:hypothetical protein